MFIGGMFSIATPRATRPFPEITFKRIIQCETGVVKVSDLVRRLISAFLSTITVISQSFTGASESYNEKFPSFLGQLTICDDFWG